MKKIIFRNLTLSLIIVFVPLAAINLGSEGLQPTTDAGLPQDPSQEKVNLTSEELQRLVYSSHVLTVIDDKPELEGALLALRELHSKNPKASPTSLVRPIKWALEEYREEALKHTLPVMWRDEVLGRYFLKFSEDPKTDPELPKRRDVVLNLLNVLLTDQDLPGLLRQQYVAVYSADQRFLAVARGPGERQNLMESCTRQAQSDPNFAAAMDDLMHPEVGVARDAPSRGILAANPSLAQTPTMQALMQLSSSSEDGSLEITMDKLKDLFTSEVDVACETVTNCQALRREIDRAREQLVRYPDKVDEIAAIIQRHEDEQSRQAKSIIDSSIAFTKLSNMTLTKASQTAKRLDICSKTLGLIGSSLAQFGGYEKNPLGAIGGIFSLAGAGCQFATLFEDQGPPPEETILKSVKLVGKMISDLSVQMDYRFDRVDTSLKSILQDLRRAVLLIGDVKQDIKQVRIDLLEVQANLHRLESELHDEIKAGFDEQLVEHINLDLDFEARTGELLPEEWYWIAENKFYSLAVDHARNKLRSNFPKQDALIDDKQLLGQFKRWPLESNLNYIKEFLHQRLDLSPLSANSLPSLPDWYVGATAYLQLAAENPQLFQNMPGSLERLDKVIQAGTELEDFFRAMTDPNLYDTVLSYYEAKLKAFKTAVRKVENDYASAWLNDLNVSMWRRWEARAPRIAVTETAVTGEYYIPRMPVDVVSISAGERHNLAIRANGTVVAWGSNWDGQCNVPLGLSDVIAVSAGYDYSLALKKDGTIVAWGDNEYGQCNVPQFGKTNVTKICAGRDHSLALLADGRVIAWGAKGYHAYEVPKGLIDVNDIAAAGHRWIAARRCINLALKYDGTVVTWGDDQGEHNVYGQQITEGTLDLPPGLSNVVAIAAGYERAVAVKNDGRVVGWPKGRKPEVRDGVTGVKAVALGNEFTLALKKDGTVEVIAGSIKGTPETNGFVAIAAGYSHALALRDDGTVVAWGDKRSGQCGLGDGTLRPVGPTTSYAMGHLTIMEDGSVASLSEDVPLGLGGIVAIASNSSHYVALKSDGTVAAWSIQTPYNVPDGLRQVVAIAASPYHALALRIDGRVEAWGKKSRFDSWGEIAKNLDYYGQCKVPPDLNDAVAIAAGLHHSLALRANGKVVAWGDNSQKQTTVPDILGNNVVAIAANYNSSLALKSDGTVVGWGANNNGQCDVPNDPNSDFVAITAGVPSFALKRDGTVVTWGRNPNFRFNIAATQTGVLAIAWSFGAGTFLIPSRRPSIENAEPLYFVRGEVAPGVMPRLRQLCDQVLREFDLDLKNSLDELTGAKVLLESVVALGLPDSLDQDDLLRGFLFGSESLIDRAGLLTLYEAERDRLSTDEWRRRASTLGETPKTRLESFHRHLNERLDALEQSPPEIPRMVAHTLVQLRLLRAAYQPPG